MNKIKSLMSFVLLSCLMAVGLTACSDDDLSTNQYQQGVHLNVFGPSPVMRGGSVHFYGSNLDQVKQVIIPGMDPVTNYEVVKAGIPSEIVVILDKEKPQPGKITLITNTDEKIETLTDLTFIEGIEYASDTQFSPSVVQPDAVLTINGEYLNLVKEVIFADNVVVNAEDFVSQSRYKIEVTVPQEARTGKVILSDGAEIPNWIYSDEILQVTTPVVEKVNTPRGEAAQQETVSCKLGETVTVSGQFFNLVAGVTIGDAETSYITVEEDQLTVSEDGKTLSFTLPAEAPDGDIDLICRSGVAVPVAILETIAPTECTATPNPAKNGQPLSISGKDLDVVASIEMPNVSEAIEFNYSDGKIVIPAVPASAQEGNLVLRMANGKGVEVAYTLVKPTITVYTPNPVSAGGALTIQGKDLDLVASVTFGEGSDAAEVAVAADGKSMTLTVPMNAKSGAPTLNLINGATAEAPGISVNEAEFCYATALPDGETEIKAGSTLTLPVANIDKLTGVQINGVDCQFIQSNGTLIIGIPETAGAGAKVRLISSNGEITYTIDIIPASEVSTVVWKGMTDITWGAGGRVIISAKSFEGVPAGAIMTACYTQKDQVWAQAQFNYADWSGINFNEGDIKFNQTLVPTDIYGWFSDGVLNRETQVVLTQEILDNILAKRQDCSDEGATDCGIIIQGSDLIFTKITISYKVSLEQNISNSLVRQDDQSQNISLPLNITWDDNGRFRILIDKDPAIKDMNLKAGKSVMYFYTSGTGQLQINNGNWGSWTTIADWENAGDKKMELVLTQDMIDWLKGTQSDGWSSTGMIIQGDGMTIKKVTILP